MGIESATYISDLVETNPESSDAVSTADDHLRLIKSAVKGTFPNVAGEVTPTHTELNLLSGMTTLGDVTLTDTQTLTNKTLTSPTLTSPVVDSGTANGVAYLNGSKVVTADSGLVFDGTNLGVGTSPDTGRRLHVLQTASESIAALVESQSSSGATVAFQDADSTGASNVRIGSDADDLVAWAGGAEQMRIDSDGNVGIGTTTPGLGYSWPGTAKITGVAGSDDSASSYGVLGLGNSRATPGGSDVLGILSFHQTNNARPLKAWIGAFSSGSGGANGYGGTLTLYTQPDNTASDPVERMRIDSSGNVGVGVTPSAWGTSGSAYRVIQFGVSGFLCGRSGNENAIIGSNAYNDGTDWRYAVSGNYASLYSLASGGHLWFTAPSGTAGNTISLSQSMGLDASGNLDVSGKVDATSFKEGVYAVSGTTPALSPGNGSIQTWTLSGNSTPTAGTWSEGESITLMIDDGSSRTVTWTSLAVTWKSDGGSAPTLNTSGYTTIALWKVGSTIYGARVGDA